MTEKQVGYPIISFNISRITGVLVIIAIFLIILSVAGQIIKFNCNVTGFFLSGLIENFFLGAEANIPTYFISFLNLVSASLLLMIAVIEKKRKQPYVFHWTVLSLIFLYISIDEIVEIHEELTDPIANILNLNAPGIFTFAWVIPAIFLLLLMGLFFLRFLCRLDSRTKTYFLIAAILFVGGAIGLEMLGGSYYDIHGSDNLTYRMMQNVEESLEMAGLIIFIWALMRYLSFRYGAVRFDLH